MAGTPIAKHPCMKTNDVLDEARRMLAGTTMMIPTVAHLKSLQEHHDIQLVRVKHQLTLLMELLDNLSPREGVK